MAARTQCCDCDVTTLITFFVELYVYRAVLDHKESISIIVLSKNQLATLIRLRLDYRFDPGYVSAGKSPEYVKILDQLVHIYSLIIIRSK